MENLNFGQLMEVYYSARRKRTLGIVFTAVAAFVSYIGLLFVTGINSFAVGVVFIFMAAPFLVWVYLFLLRV